MIGTVQPFLKHLRIKYYKITLIQQSFNHYSLFVGELKKKSMKQKKIVEDKLSSLLSFNAIEIGICFEWIWRKMNEGTMNRKCLVNIVKL